MTERLLIGTHNKLLLRDGAGIHTVWDEHSHPDLTSFYGITWDRERIYLAEGGPVKPSRVSYLHIFDGRLRHQAKIALGPEVLSPHQIFWWAGNLYITNTALDKISVWDGRALRHVDWKTLGEPTTHPNSIWCDGRNFYVVEHRKTEMPKKIRIFDLDFVLTHTVSLDGCFTNPAPRGIHNVYVENGILFVGGTREIVCFDWLTQKTKTVALGRGIRYVRGFARTPGKFFVGLSRVVHQREKRVEGNASILVMDDEFGALESIPLTDTGGVLEIRAIDGPDLAHNGMECPYGR